jgi:hypothetical protein
MAKKRMTIEGSSRATERARWPWVTFAIFLVSFAAGMVFQVLTGQDLATAALFVLAFELGMLSSCLRSDEEQRLEDSYHREGGHTDDACRSRRSPAVELWRKREPGGPHDARVHDEEPQEACTGAQCG